jgi:hypothetical protein
MPDDRLFHKRLGHSEKVNRLTDFEDLAWRAYILSADDFGVMRFSALTLQADHDRFAARPQRAVQRALERVRDATLIVTFDHQGRTYCAQPDWQNHQRVKHPRQTINPKPPTELLEKFSSETRELFLDWPGKRKEKLEKDFRNSSETFGHLARARAREMADANAKGSEGGVGGTASRDDLSGRAGDFCRWYEDTHERLFQVGYIGSRSDYDNALRLCDKLSDAELRDAALVWFGMEDDFATTGTRSIAKFASRATGCLQLVKARGIA